MSAAAAVEWTPQGDLEEAIAAAIGTVQDPEIPVSIVELGLIYGVEVREGGNVHIRMTLTAPGCPVAGEIVREVREKTLAVDGVNAAEVELVFDPPWSKDRMTEVARFTLGFEV